MMMMSTQGSFRLVSQGQPNRQTDFESAVVAVQSRRLPKADRVVAFGYDDEMQQESESVLSVDPSKIRLILHPGKLFTKEVSAIKELEPATEPGGPRKVLPLYARSELGTVLLRQIAFRSKEQILRMHNPDSPVAILLNIKCSDGAIKVLVVDSALCPPEVLSNT